MRDAGSSKNEKGQRQKSEMRRSRHTAPCNARQSARIEKIKRVTRQQKKKEGKKKEWYTRLESEEL